MTRKSLDRLERDRRGFPRLNNVASMRVDRTAEQIVFTTNDMLVKQLHRDGPKIARSFDKLTRNDIADCSVVFGRIHGLLMRHLPRLDDEKFKATASRLLFHASNTITASIEVARHGYPRQYGALGRILVETLATVVVLAMKEGALEEFYAGSLQSSKCVGWAKAALPPIGPYYGMLNRFIHVGQDSSAFEGPGVYTADSEALNFVRASLRGNVWIFDIVTDLVFSDEEPVPRFWVRKEREAVFDPTPTVKAWTDEFFSSVGGPELASE